MRVIAKAGTRKYILEATADEIDFLAGRSVCKGSYGDERQVEYILGTEFKIITAFEQIHRNDKRKAEIEYLRNTLACLLAGLDMVEPIIEEPRPQEVESDPSQISQT